MTSQVRSQENSSGYQCLGGLVSVVQLCVSSFADAQLCVDALLGHTRRPLELAFVVERLSPIAAYLDGIRAVAPVHIEVIKRDPRVPLSLTIALRSVCGESVAVLDGKLIVTDAWLDQLV